MMAHYVIDLINPDNDEKPKKKTVEEPKEKPRSDHRLVRKQVITIDGKIISVP